MTAAANDAAAVEMRAYREARKVSLRKTAAAMGISAPYLCDLEKGRRTWTDELQERFKAACEPTSEVAARVS